MPCESEYRHFFNIQKYLKWVVKTGEPNVKDEKQVLADLEEGATKTHQPARPNIWREGGANNIFFSKIV